ncbi:hypothetical protein ABIE49_006123 [Bradyrhizobium sp. OAE829]
MARFAGNQTGIIFAGLLTATGLALLYGLGFSLRKQRKGLPPETGTSLKTKIEQLLTEARSAWPAAGSLTFDRFKIGFVWNMLLSVVFLSRAMCGLQRKDQCAAGPVLENL